MVDYSQLLASVVRGLRDMAVAPNAAWCVADEEEPGLLLLLAVDSGGRSPNRSSILAYLPVDEWGGWRCVNRRLVFLMEWKWNGMQYAVCMTIRTTPATLLFLAADHALADASLNRLLLIITTARVRCNIGDGRDLDTLPAPC